MLTDQLNRRTLHFIIHIDVGLRRSNRFMPSKGSQHPHADAFAGQRSYEAASS